MRKRLPVALFVVSVLFLGLGLGLVAPALASMNREGKIVPSLTTSLNLGLPGTNSNSTLPASINKSFLQGNGLLSGFLYATRIFTPSSTSLDIKVPDAVSINLAGAGSFNLSEPILLAGTLQNMSTGTGVANKIVTFSTNGVHLGQTHTDNAGAFTIKIKKVLPAGTYLVTATFKGAHLLSPASAATTFVILPATVVVQTVPATAGITFQMDGRQFISGADGLASIKIGEAGTYRLDVLLDKYSNPSQRVEFGRWTGESYEPSRDFDVPAKSIISVGLNIFHKVKFNFVDLSGFPVDPSRITSISIRSIQGDVFSLKPGDSPWLPASRTAHRQTGLEKTELLYSINSIIIDGSNVVNSAQQRFFAQTDASWTISVLLYSLRITTKDGLFGAPVGTSIDVEFPNKQIKNYPLDSSGKLEIHALARGIYHVSIVGIKGLGTSTPVALSRNQVVNINIITPLDLAAFGSVSAGLALGLIIYGRPWLLQLLLGRKRSPSRKPKWTSIHEN